MTLNPKQFLSEPEELHSLVIGLCEVIAFWPPRFDYPLERDHPILSSEYHYYSLGRALGILAWLGISCAIKKIFFE